MANPRNYVKDADDTLTSVNASDYETGKGANARLRKINLNVDLATQAELNEAFNLLSNAIAGATGDLTAYYKKTEVDTISTALSTAFKATDDAISAQLSTFALSTTVADAYKVKVSDAAEQTSSFVYTITQGELTAGTINVPKDMFVEGASFKGTVLVLSVRGQDTPISTDLSGLVDVYTGGSTTDAVVSVDKDTNVITVTATEAIARVGTAEDASSANTIYGAKKYAEEKAAATAENAISSVAGDNTYLTASTTDNAVTVSATDKLTAVVNVVETTSAAWSAAETNAKTYTDTVSAALSTTLHNELTAETQARETADTALSNAIDALSGSVNGASGDDYVAATVENNKVKVSATDKLTAAVNAVETSADTWNAAAPLTALEAEQTARANADTALSTAIDALSATYASKSTVDGAATTLDADAALTAKNLSAYNDIDEIIDELEALKAAVKTFAGTLKTA